MHDGMSMVEGCVVHGGDVGITMHTMMGDITRNVVVGATHHGIEMTEMSMGKVDRNEIHGARGAGIYCGDHSVCEVEHNRLVGGAGPGVLAFYYSGAELAHNVFVDTPRAAHSDDSMLTR